MSAFELASMLQYANDQSELGEGEMEAMRYRSNYWSAEALSALSALSYVRWHWIPEALSLSCVRWRWIPETYRISIPVQCNDLSSAVRAFTVLLALATRFALLADCNENLICSDFDAA